MTFKNFGMLLVLVNLVCMVVIGPRAWFFYSLLMGLYLIGRGK